MPTCFELSIGCNYRPQLWEQERGFPWPLPGSHKGPELEGKVGKNSRNCAAKLFGYWIVSTKDKFFGNSSVKACTVWGACFKREFCFSFILLAAGVLIPLCHIILYARTIKVAIRDLMYAKNMKMYWYHCHDYSYCKSATVVKWLMNIFYTRFPDKNGAWLVTVKSVEKQIRQVLGTCGIIYWRETASAISELKTQVKNRCKIFSCKLVI